MSRVRPGVLETRASWGWLVNAFSSELLPTLERPTRATSAWQAPSCLASDAETRKRASRNRWSMSYTCLITAHPPLPHGPCREWILTRPEGEVKPYARAVTAVR